MMRSLTFHPLVQKDLNEIIDCYYEEAGPHAADRFELMDRFAALGAEVSYYDPHVPEIGPTREHAKWQGVKSIAWLQEVVTAYDAVVIATNHKAVNLCELAA
jgi:UDP-N-acetyl-D-mannosaminuronate dehydrogenase